VYGLCVALTINAALLIAGAGCAPVDTKQRLTLGGAQIPVELVESWLGGSREPRFEIARHMPVYLSQHGFDGLISGECALACTDRTIADSEIERAGDLKLDGRRIAFYGFALYVHPANTIDSIFAGHLELLFQKKITDWKELGSGEGRIRLIGPEKSTRGGNVLMRQARIWFADPTWEAMSSDDQIIAAVAADPLALGFASIGLDRGVRYVGLRMQRNGPAAFPSLEEIESDRYGLAKVIYVYFRSPPTPAVQAALDRLFSPSGQDTVRATGVWPIALERSTITVAARR
jgi:ABC-type phosphate transport system substrate-binding protein